MELILRDILISKRTGTFNIYPIGDTHVGHRNCDIDKFRKHINIVEKDPDGYVIIMGDNCDNRNPRHKHFDSEQCDPHIPQDKFNSTCYKIFKNEMKKIKDKIIGIHEGNHDRSEQYQEDYTRGICDDLKVPYLGYMAYTILRVKFGNDKSKWRLVKIYSTHGSGGGGRRSGGKINRVEDMALDCEADIYIMGHNHLRSCTDSIIDVPYINKDGKVDIKHDTKIFVNSGSYIKTRQVGNFSYTEKMGCRPQDTGCLVLTIKPEYDIINWKVLK